VKQKHKKKINPFAERLQPGEEILWFASHPQGKPLSQMDKIGIGMLFLFPFICACAVASAIPTGTQTVPTAYQIESFLQIVLRLGGPLTIVLALMLLGYVVSRSSENNYAITNQRVLSDGDWGFQDLSLAEIEEIQIHYISGGFVSVRFGYMRLLSKPIAGRWQDDNRWWTWLKKEDAENILETISALREFSIVVEVKGHKPKPVPSA
jgi:hypothetical protein